MTLTINTNESSLIVQKSLSDATKGLNQAIERMTTGYKINSARDDAAGYSVTTKMETQLSSIQVCQDNVQMGISLANTLIGSYDIALTHLQRMRDLVEEAQNGTYGADSIAAIQAEFDGRCKELERIANLCEYNGRRLVGVEEDRITFRFQVGITSDNNSVITFQGPPEYDYYGDIISFTSYDTPSHDITRNGALHDLDNEIKYITQRQTEAGAFINRMESAGEALEVQYANTLASLSTIKDADIAVESSSYIKHQILQQASATLLATANQSPALALQLI